VGLLLSNQFLETGPGCLRSGVVESAVELMLRAVLYARTGLLKLQNGLSILILFRVENGDRRAACVGDDVEDHKRDVAPEHVDAAAVAGNACEALRKGARTIMLFGGEPTIHLPAVLEFVAAMPDDARLVWKTNAHGSAPARLLLDGMFEVWLADFKFGNDACASRLANIPNYSRVVKENLVWASEHSDLIVRHLLMPGHIDCCWQPIAQWLAENLPGVKVNLRAGFWPGWHSANHPELQRTVSVSETSRAEAIAHQCELNLIP